MALIKCPECGSSISDKAEKCPHCGLPATYFMQRQTQTDVNYDNLANILVSFDSDYSRLFSKNHYITHRDEKYLQETYGIRWPLEMSPGREAACRAVFGTWGFFRTMHGKTAPSC